MHIRRALVSCLLFSGFALGSCTDDEKAGTVDGGSSTVDAATEPGAACESSDDCNDGLFCNGEETCEAGHCAPGKALVCNDDIACTVDACSERTHACESLPADEDGDGHYEANCKDAKGKTLGDDCDDLDPLRFPGNIEFCDEDNHDEDCDSATFGEKDADNDTFLDGKCCNAESDAKGAKLTCGTDCDDRKPSVHPGATEVCDLYDNDCDAKTDEGVAIEQYPDGDRDGHGKEGSKAELKCADSVGFAPEDNDCKDNDPEVYKGQFEICDKKDNDCDEKVDEVHEDAPWFVDADKDTFGDPTSVPVYSCERIPGRVLSHNDCDDEKAAINPKAAEICDGIDNDCNKRKDFQLDVNDFEDDDDDDIADSQCVGGQDCNDENPNTGMGLDEVCDHVDNDCDDSIDEETAQTVWFLDKDGDGWGVKHGTALTRCEPIPGRAANLGDCDDESNASHPGADETCNGHDDDCDGRVDEGTDFECTLDHAVGVCKLGECAVLSCLPGRADCNFEPKDGCECNATIAPLQPLQSCAYDGECQDGNYCNGHERCGGDNFCYAGTPVNCSASGTVLQGNVLIETSLDVAALQGIQTITGSVTISASSLKNLTGLESLTTIGGNLIVDGNLAHGKDPDRNRHLVALVGSGLSNLVNVGGNIRIADDIALTTVRFPSLVTAGSLEIVNNDELTQITGFDHLVKLDGDLRIAGNPKLTKISMPVLESVGMSFLVQSNTLLKDMSLPKLASIGSQQIEPSLEISYNAALTSLNDVGAGALGCGSDMCSATVMSNPKLCSGTDLTARLHDFDGITVYDNRIVGCADTGVVFGSNVRTFDGVAYQLAPIGELTLVKSKDDALEVQARMQAYGDNSNMSLATVVAANVGGNRVEISLSGVLLDGATVTFTDLSWTPLSGGGQVKHEGNKYTLLWPDGSAALLVQNGSFIETQIELSVSRRDRVTGLLSGFDGGTSNELRSRTGTSLGNAATFASFYAFFVDSWRIVQADSLFTYVQGFTTTDYTDRDYPLGRPSFSMFPMSNRVAAQAACVGNNVTEPFWADACALDLALIGNSAIAADYAALAAPKLIFDQDKLPTKSTVGNFPPFMAEPSDKQFMSIIQTLPPDDSTNIDGASPIALYFTDLVNPATVSDTTLQVKAGSKQIFGSISANLSDIGNTILYFQPFVALPSSTKITISVPKDGVKDNGGNGLQNSFTSSFTTRLGVLPAPGSLSFENPADPGWAFSGDGAITMSSLSVDNVSINAPDGKLLAAISSQGVFGQSANDDSTSSLTSGPISVPGGQKHLLFDYDFVSEEFDTYVDEPYDDFLSVTVAGPNGSISVTVASVHEVGKIDSTPVTVSGMSAPQHTGFKVADIELGSIGSPIKLTFTVTDVGDKTVTSAGFIDNVRFQ